MEPALHPRLHRVHPVRRVPVLEQALKEHAGKPVPEEEHVEHAEPPWLASILPTQVIGLSPLDALRHFDANERRSCAGVIARSPGRSHFPEGALDGPIVATSVAAPSATAVAVFQTCMGDGCGRRFYDLGGPVLPKAARKRPR